MSRILRENGLSIALFGLFAVSLIGQTIAGQATYNQTRRSHGRSPVGYLEYLATGHNIEGIFENWESEFLQMAANVLLTVYLFQKGSAASKRLDGPGAGRDSSGTPGPDAPWPAQQGGWVRTIYAYSLPIAFLALFALSFWLHAIGGRLDYNDQQTAHGHSPVSLPGFLATSTFWFQSFQNYQSEFLSLAAMVVLSIFLRQEGSPESKKVDEPHWKTGT